MATLIAFYDSHGCVGRCDAKCYTAYEPGCSCICGGANHGAGLAEAAETPARTPRSGLPAPPTTDGTSTSRARRRHRTTLF